MDNGNSNNSEKKDMTIGKMLLAGLSGGMLWLSDFPIPVMPVMFFATVPLLVALYDSKPITGFLLTAISWFIGLLWIWQNIGNVVPISIVAMFAVWSVLLYGLLGALSSWSAPRVNPILWVLIFPAGSVLIEKLNIYIGLGLWFTASGPLAETPWLLASSSIGGAFTVTFLSRLVPSAIALIIAEKDRRKTIPTALLTAVITVAIVIYGSYRHTDTLTNDVRGGSGSMSDEVGRHIAPAYDKTVRMAVVYYEPPFEVTKHWKGEDTGALKSEDTWDIVKNYEKLIKRAAADNAKLVATPEYSLYVPKHEVDRFEIWARNLARELEITLVFGFMDLKAPANRIIIATADGNIARTAKHHLVHGLETWMEAGENEPVIVNDGEVTLSAKICYDGDFPWAFRQMAKKGVNLVVLPSNDWWTVAVLHHQQGIYRGAENGMALVRPSRWGISSIVDPWGNILARGTPDKDMITYIIADVPITDGGTIYTATGDWIPFLGLLVVLAIIILTIRSKKEI